jgi:hypothetical protein
MRGTRPSFVLFSYGLLAAILPVLAGCGGAANKAAEAPASSMAPAEAEPTTVEEAQAQIDRAKQQLAGNAGSAGSAGMPSAGTGATTPSTMSQPPADASRHQETSADKPEPSPCESPCRAIASMRRAVTAICRIAGDTDARCEGATQTLVDSESRVKTCGC